MEIHTIDLGFQGNPEVIAAFLLESGGELALIETGPGSTLQALLEGLRGLGVEAEDVRKVFVTHIHLDHAGAAGWWAQQGATVYAHPRAAKHLIDPSKLMDSARRVYGDLLDIIWAEMLPAPSAKVTELLDGEHVTVGKVKFTAWDTPGHARHHHTFLVDGKIAFTGDVAGARLPGSGFLSVTSAPPQFDLEEYEQSIQRLQKAGLEKLYLTHFGEVTDVADHLERYLETVRESTAFVRDRMAEGLHGEALEVAYRAYNLERAYREEVPPLEWQRYEAVNGSGMCANGIELYLKKHHEKKPHHPQPESRGGAESQPKE